MEKARDDTHASRVEELRETAHTLSAMNYSAKEVFYNNSISSLTAHVIGRFDMSTSTTSDGLLRKRITLEPQGQDDRDNALKTRKTS